MAKNEGLTLLFGGSVDGVGVLLPLEILVARERRQWQKDPDPLRYSTRWRVRRMESSTSEPMLLRSVVIFAVP